MSRYVIEIKPEYEDKIRGIMILGAENSNLYVDSMAVDELEELNSDYINEHFGELQDAAYQRGLDDGKKAFDLLDAERDSEYQRGLNDAWEAARKIVTWPDRSLINSDTFDLDPGENIFTKYSASRAIEKLKAYEEQKADGEIKVGDEVISLKRNGEVIEDMSPWIVTYETKYSYQGFEADGMSRKNPKDCVRKTGRHFDIQKILEEMRR